MIVRFLFLTLVQTALTLRCYDCLDCPYPWSSFAIQTYGSISNIFSRVQSCYKKEFYNAIDRRLDRVVRGALDRDCQAGKFETQDERSITYCCYSNYCNRAVSRQVVDHLLMNAIALVIFVMFVRRE